MGRAIYLTNMTANILETNCSAARIDSLQKAVALGADVTWGDRQGVGYQVGLTGRWTVGGNDGFSRKAEDHWEVQRLQVGSETWTIAS